MTYGKDLKKEVMKHSKMMKQVFKNLRINMKEQSFKDFFKLARAYYDDSQHFFEKKELIQSFEALIISWAYIDAGLRLNVFELKDEVLEEYFTIESSHE